MWFFLSDQWGNTYIACHLPVVPIHILRTFALADNGSGVPIEPGGVWCEVQRIGRALSRYIYQVTNLWFGNHTTQYSHGLFYGPTQHPPKMMPTSYTSQIVESGTLRSLCSQLQSAFVRQSCPSFSRQLQISLINIDQKLYSEKISLNNIHWISTCSSRCIASLHGSSGWTVKWLFLPENPTSVNVLIWTE